MECIKRPVVIDYQEAAGRLLVALSFIAGKFPGSPPRPVPAAKLCGHAFSYDLRRHWTRETRRRRIRDAMIVARRILQERGRRAAIAGSGRGYWLTGDSMEIAWYAAQRRRRGLANLAAASRVARTVQPGQSSLFATDSPLRH